MTKSQISALKLALIAEGVHGTSRMAPLQLAEAAHKHGLIDARAYAEAIADDDAASEEAPKALTPRPRRVRHDPRLRATELDGKQPETTSTTTPTTTGQQNPMTTPAQAELLSALMATMAPTAPAMDEARIIELINTHSPRKLISVSTDGAEAKEVEGITHKTFEDILAYMSCGLQLYLYGRSGAGKSHTAGQVAEALDLEFFAQGSLLAKFEALGSLTATGYNPSVIRNWLDSDGGLLCIDEIDASDPRALVTIMSIFDSNGSITFPDGVTCTRNPAKHFLVVTANTTGNGASAAYNGRLRLDGAIKARFVFVEHDYDAAIEDSFAPAPTVSWLRRYRAQALKMGLEGSQITPRHIKMAGAVVANKDIPRERQKAMVTNIARQALTEEQSKAVIAGMNQ